MPWSPPPAWPRTPGSSRCGPVSTSCCPTPGGPPPRWIPATRRSTASSRSPGPRPTPARSGSRPASWILPQRNPLVVAKQVASLDVLSGGRVMLGVGAGYLEAEFRALGADFAARGPITDEYLDAIAALWYDDQPAYHGQFVDFDGIDAHPRPVQRPVPIVIGGHSPAAYRRAVARGQGGTATGSPPTTRRGASPASGRGGRGRAPGAPRPPRDQRHARGPHDPGAGRAVRRARRRPPGAARRRPRRTARSGRSRRPPPRSTPSESTCYEPAPGTGTARCSSETRESRS